MFIIIIPIAVTTVTATVLHLLPIATPAGADLAVLATMLPITLTIIGSTAESS